ncbi:MAG: glycosyltransferase family 4 protein [Thermoanaerobaculia bacterium]
MVRFLFVTQTAHPWGGVETWLEGLAGSLAKDHDVTLGLVRGRKFHDPDRYRAARLLSVPSIDIAAPTGTAEGRVRALGAAIARTAPDVVIPVNIADTLEAVRRQKARRRDIRLFYPLHGLGADYLADVRAYAGLIDLAVATNRLAERALMTISGMARERVDYVPYGVEPAVDPPSFSPSSPLRLLYSGRLEQEQKRVRDLIPLCQELDRRGVSYELNIVGEGEEGSALRNALSGNERVRFSGLLSRKELYDQVYPEAQILILLSAWETGPIVALEAMAHGATLVTTSYRGLQAEGRIVHEVNALIGGVGDVPALASAVQLLDEDRKLLDRLRRAAFDTVNPSCSLESSLLGWRASFERGLALPIVSGLERASAPKPAGRLDGLFGVSLAETIRAAAGLGMMHREPGAEWPHTMGRPSDAEAIEESLAELDR